MTELPVLVDLDPSNIETSPCCWIKNPAHPGRCEKNGWLLANFKKGLRARLLLAPDGKQCGYIEYIPGESAWRAVDAPAYLFIHCIYIHRYQHRGFGGQLLDSVVEDARRNGMHGVAVAARSGPWLADPRLFLANGFEVADTAPPDYQLLVRKLDPRAPDPAFRKIGPGVWKKYEHGLTIIRSAQCPHIAKFADEIAETAEREYGMTPRVVELRSCRDAQNAPTPYAVFAIIHNGRLLADHQISRTRFRNIMNKLILPPTIRAARRRIR
jgi:GNAT superfamily N-acetyltransferase